MSEKISDVALAINGEQTVPCGFVVAESTSPNDDGAISRLDLGLGTLEHAPRVEGTAMPLIHAEYSIQMNETIPDVALHINKEQRTPCVIVVDGSTSMNDYGAIGRLNQGLKTLEQALKADETACVRVQVMVIRMGGYDEAEVIQEWVDAIDFEAPTIDANGSTPMGKAVDLAMTEIEAQKGRYRMNAVSYTRPWIFLLSDGAPNDADWEGVAERCRKAQLDRRFVLFAVGVGEGAQKEAMERFSVDRPMVRVEQTKFDEMFQWLSSSLSAASSSSPGTQVPLPPVEWGSISN